MLSGVSGRGRAQARSGERGEGKGVRGLGAKGETGWCAPGISLRARTCAAWCASAPRILGATMSYNEHSEIFNDIELERGEGGDCHGRYKLAC